MLNLFKIRKIPSETLSQQALGIGIRYEVWRLNLAIYPKHLVEVRIPWTSVPILSQKSALTRVQK